MEEAKKQVKKLKKTTKKYQLKKKTNWIMKNAGDTKNIWAKLNRKEVQMEIETTWIEGRESTNMEDITNYIENYWKEMGKIEEEEEDGKMGENERLDEILNIEIKMEELYKAKMEMKNGKSTGWDKIPNEFIKYGGQIIDDIMSKLFSMMIKEEYIPKEWKEDKLVMIYKKEDKNKCENYRGISISSNVLKLYCRVMSKRVMKYVESNKILGEVQNAFRKNRGAMDNLVILQAILNKAKAEHDQTYLCFLDIEKAYDNVSRQKLWEKLEEKGLGGKFLRIIQEMYRNQRRKVKTKTGWTNWVSCNKGLRQGCVFSPLLFAIYIDDIMMKINNDYKITGGASFGEERISILAFADDILLISKEEK